MLTTLLTHSSVGEAGCHAISTHEQPPEKPVGQEAKPPAKSHASEPSWKQLLLPSQAFRCLQPHRHLVHNLRESLSQNGQDNHSQTDDSQAL